VDQLDGARVLLVDDSKLMRRKLGRQLDTAGAAVTAVRTAADALAALRAGPFDVMVCDLRLPGTDGLALIRAVRTDGGANAGIPAVAITADADEESRVRARESGFDDYLPKLVSALLVPTVARLRRPR
jgi:CheY-like chemotaxis protein